MLERLIVESGMFDADWYRARYPDVALIGMEPLPHFVRFGAQLGRSPGPDFDPGYYAQSNADVAAGGSSPLLHYLQYGRQEGRPGKAPLVVQAAEEGVQIAALGAPRLYGHLDRATPTLIEGWAVDEAAPGAPVRLQLFVDGEKVMDFATSRERHDVTANKLPGANAGFSLHLAQGILRTGQSVEVREVTRARSLGEGVKVIGASAVRSRLPAPTYLTTLSTGAMLPVTVVVPVYNSPDAVAACLASLTENPMPDSSEVLIIDDGSTDPRIAELLRRYATVPGFRLEMNPSNIGYTRTVNRALELAAGRDVVLLNSDTTVTPRWLHNLRYCAYSQPDIGSVTALSDNAGAFSVPEIGVANSPPAYLDSASTAKVVTQAGEGIPIDVPTGNGFCLYLRRHALDVVGGFDEAKYPRGYGEENDLCMRLMYAGWRNVICDKAYVFHLRSQSFGDMKRALVEDGARQLAIDYPEYRALISRFNDIEFAMRRNRLRKTLLAASSALPKPRVLFVISTTTGGTPQTNLDLMRAVAERYEGFLLRCDSLTLTLSKLVNGNLVTLETVALHAPIRAVPHTSDEYDRLLLDILYRHSIDVLHIRHVAWHSLGIASAAKALQIPVIFSVHDFYALCPSVNLLDTEHRYVGTSEDGARLNPLWPQQVVPDGFVRRWRLMMGRFLADCSAFVTTSPSAKRLFGEVYPEHVGRMRVIPHGRDFDLLAMNSTTPQRGRPMKVLVPGNISVSKGALLLRDVSVLDEEGRVELHFLGHAIQEVKRVGVHHGAYKREEFQAKVAAIAPSVGVVLSIWPETFCHTLTEMWAAGIPVLGLDTGAVGDRIRATGGGWLLPADATPSDILQKLVELANNPTEVLARQEDLARWQAAEAVVHDTAHMASSYRQLYSESMLGGRRPLRVGLVMKLRGLRHRPPTAHIRVLRPMRAAAQTGRLDPRPISVGSLIAGAASAFDVVVIQRDAVPPAQTELLLDALRIAGVPWIFEMDDMLWDLPKDHLDHAIDDVAIASMRAIAQGAACLTTSSAPLAAALSETNARVEIIPNALDETLWCSPLPAGLSAEVAGALGLSAERRYILYMGSNSHAKDLEMIVPALERVLDRHPDVQILQIGGGHPLPFAKEVTCPPRFPTYPEFVVWFRALCSHCTLALAPLRADAFNEAKSDIKFLDYSLAGVPAIFSDFGPYRCTVHDGFSGLLRTNDVDSWQEGIEVLLDRPDVASRIAEQASKAASERTLARSGVGEVWVDLLERIASR
ncbi:glycosyltransferase [Pseudoxanthomonas sp. GM95]|uniref:glycosyltransferase n=1 Tax=Pseudoxanthomonas sp. GM95 TaxID=1881043 RepID=UPI001587F7E3|nr:glycosyltransferase [Pseudoxanthomonas sp. GM95]